MLLGTTLLRLVLNIASTRLILGADASSPAAVGEVAGAVISGFGGFVAGGSLIVGFIIFAILVIVQFVVITKGATRMSEVTARFTLDAMPGKQMAIDADLSAGLIDEQEATRRRGEITAEADFYGAMDGASSLWRRCRRGLDHHWNQLGGWHFGRRLAEGLDFCRDGFCVYA